MMLSRDGKMGPARWAGPPARLKRYGPGHEFQPVSPCQPGPSSPLARRASPRAKTGQPAARKTKTGGPWRTLCCAHTFSSFLNFLLFLGTISYSYCAHPPPTPPPNHKTRLFFLPLSPSRLIGRRGR